MEYFGTLRCCFAFVAAALLLSVRPQSWLLGFPLFWLLLGPEVTEATGKDAQGRGAALMPIAYLFTSVPAVHRAEFVNAASRIQLSQAAHDFSAISKELHGDP